MCPHRHIDMNTHTHEYFDMAQFLSVFFRGQKPEFLPNAAKTHNWTIKRAMSSKRV